MSEATLAAALEALPQPRVLVGPALAGPGGHRSHLYHPGFRHEFRAADPASGRP